MKLSGLFRFSIFILILFMVVLINSGCSLLPEEKVDAPPPLLEPPEPRVVTHEVTRGYIAEEISGLARVAAVKEAPLYFKKTGRVKDIFVEYGQWVEKDKPLARLETGEQEFQYNLAKIDLQKINLELEKTKKLVELGRISQYDLKLAQLDYEKAHLVLEKYQEQIDNSTIKAPFKGKIVSINLKEAEEVEKYDTVIRLVDPTELELQMEISERYLSKIVPGQKAKVNLDSGEWLAARVAYVPAAGDEIAPGQPDRRIKLELLDKNHQELTYDDLVRAVIIIQERENALLIPKAALRQFMGRRFVRVMQGDIRKEVDVEIGIEGSTNVEILDGLEEGDIVIGR